MIYVAIKVDEDKHATLVNAGTDFDKLVGDLHRDLQYESLKVRGFIIEGAEVCHGTIVCTSCEGKCINPNTRVKCHHCHGSGKIPKVI